MKKLFEINPGVDRAAAAARYAAHTRVQIRDVLTEETAQEIRRILQATPWGMAMRGGDGEDTPPESIRNSDLARPEGVERANRAGRQAHAASAKGEYAFRFAHYPIVKAVQEEWHKGGPHELLLEYVNAPDFLQLVRDVTGIDELVKADGQATLFAGQHYLGRHIDSHVAEGWRVAYILNFAIDDWHPDWGGYLVFYDENGDIVDGFKPRFNALNLLAVPQSHAVTYVPPFAPVGRYAITGWLRDR